MMMLMMEMNIFMSFEGPESWSNNECDNYDEHTVVWLKRQKVNTKSDGWSVLDDWTRAWLFSSSSFSKLLNHDTYMSYMIFHDMIHMIFQDIIQIWYSMIWYVCYDIPPISDDEWLWEEMEWLIEFHRVNEMVGTNQL